VDARAADPAVRAFALAEALAGSGQDLADQV